jgi:hypothetical protein
MKTIKKIQFRRLQIIKLSGAYYVNTFVEKSVFITLEGVKFFKVKKSKLRQLGVIFAEDRKSVKAAPSVAPVTTQSKPTLPNAA